MNILGDYDERNCYVGVHRKCNFMILFAVVVVSSFRILYLDAYDLVAVRSSSPIASVVLEHIDQLPEATAHDSNNHSIPTIHGDERKVVWSPARGDRSGMAINNMLASHAYAVHHNYIYGGACRWSLPKSVDQLSRLHQHMELIDALGLSEVLTFDCPPNSTVKLLKKNQYGGRNAKRYMSSAYFEYLRSLIKYPKKPERRTIAVHVRRGDITPCGIVTDGLYRYLANQYYLRLIDRYNPQNDSNVFVYSESHSYESFDVFRERGYHVVLDGPLAEVWQGIMMSDVAILSRSAFSLVPAYLSKGTVVFPECWLSPLPGWDVVKEDPNATALDFQRLNTTCQRQEGKKRART